MLRIPKDPPHLGALRVAVRHHVADHGLGGARFTVALSGGADSSALLAACVAEGLDVQAITVDHQLQPGSAQVARDAVHLAEELGVRARILTVVVPAEGSLEAAARLARYRALAQALGDEPVFTAHTLDDQAETFLLAALRGNATGMSPHSVVEGAQVHRPLLGARRADTRGACAEVGIAAWEDPQNADPGFLRVRLRREVLPLLADVVGGDPAPALARAAGRAAAHAAVVRKDAAGLDPGTAGGLAALREEGAAVRREALAQYLRASGAQTSAATLDAVERLITHWRGQGAVSVRSAARGQRLEVGRRGGKLYVSTAATERGGSLKQAQKG